MRRPGLSVLLMAGAMAGSACAKSKKDAPLPQFFCQAQSVYVTTVDGGPANPNILPEDRTAAVGLFDNLQDWRHYTLVNERHQADLVWVVRTGRVVSGVGGTNAGGVGSGDSSVRVPIGAGQGRSPGAAGQSGGGMGQDPGGMDGPPGMGGSQGGSHGGMGGELGPPDDLLWIYMKNGEGRDTLIWKRSMDDGLRGSMPLFQQIRAAVEAACKAQPAKGQ